MIETRQSCSSNRTRLIPWPQLHQLLGHHNENRTWKIATALCITIKKGSMDNCEPCPIVKAKQKNTAHDLLGHSKSTTLNEKVYLDLSFLYVPNKK